MAVNGEFIISKWVKLSKIVSSIRNILIILKSQGNVLSEIWKVFITAVLIIRLKRYDFGAHLQRLVPSSVLMCWHMPVILLNGPLPRVASGFCYLNNIISEDAIIVVEITVCLLTKNAWNGSQKA